ncbi:hypothetical protein MUP05_08285 [Candidatus Bathyarchaeota archaeon]|nr:hypothetical protein [Candidatus Bathyarchaeota archaeon]
MEEGYGNRPLPQIKTEKKRPLSPTTKGQSSWMRVGTEPTQEQLSELKELRAKTVVGTVLSYKEAERVRFLTELEKKTPR